MYLLTERHVISALEEAAHSGKDVRVMLEGHPYGSGSSSPSQTIDRLNAAGVQAKTTNPAFALTHEKGKLLLPWLSSIPVVIPLSECQLLWQPTNPNTEEIAPEL